MQYHTIESGYEYRITNIVRYMFRGLPIRIHLEITNGDGLEDFLDNNKDKLATLLMDDIQEYMGFDELLKQVKGE